MLKRWWQYQNERFPLAPYSLLVLALTYSASASGAFSMTHFAAVFAQAMIAFALLRIADEFKDYQDDVAYRPYRPVPRGLVSLKELATLGVALSFCQWGVALYLNNHFWLLAWWVYFALMSKEFFIEHALKARPLVYLFSHMAIMPILGGLLAAGFQPLQQTPYAFMALAFFTGLLLEIGRKIRLPDEEENGVETYSVLWGRQTALIFWYCVCGILTLLMFSQSLAAGFITLIGFMLSGGVFLKPLKAKKIDTLTAVWMLVSYLLWGFFA